MKTAILEKKSLKDKLEEKKDKFVQKKNNFQLILSLIGAIFFVLTTIIGAKKSYTESSLYKYIIIFTVAYLIVFIIFALFHIKNSKKLSQDTKKFKANFKIIKLILNLLFIGSSLLIFIDSIQGIKDAYFYDTLKTIGSGFLLVLKLFTTLFKLRRKVKSQIK